MSGRLTRTAASLTIASHIWVCLIVAPWHQLEEHVLPVAKGASQTERPVRTCSCHHHHGPRDAAIGGESREDRPARVPHAPEHDDNCSFCQMVAQPFAAVGEPPAICIPEDWEAVSLGETRHLAAQFLCRPISRGPPLV